MQRIRAWGEWAVGVARRAGQHAWRVARDPLRLLPVLAVASLLLIAVPLTITGVARIGRDVLEWRVDSAVPWSHTTGRVVGVRDDDGLHLRVRFHDRAGRGREADVYVGATGRTWIDQQPKIRYDRSDPTVVEIVGFTEPSPVPALLVAGAPLGVGVAAGVLAVGVWKRRKLLAVSAHPLTALRSTFVIAGVALAAGLGAWAAGTVWQRGWSAIASSAGHLGATVFGDLLGVLVPLVAFALGCLVTAWLARHRHGDEHEGLLSSAYRFIDRAAGMVPSPEELRPESRRDDPSKVT
jgi:hypothetical protein